MTPGVTNVTLNPSSIIMSITNYTVTLIGTSASLTARFLTVLTAWCGWRCDRCLSISIYVWAVITVQKVLRVALILESTSISTLSSRASTTTTTPRASTTRSINTLLLLPFSLFAIASFSFLLVVLSSSVHAPFFSSHVLLYVLLSLAQPALSRPSFPADTE